MKCSKRSDAIARMRQNIFNFVTKKINCINPSIDSMGVINNSKRVRRDVSMTRDKN